MQSTPPISTARDKTHGYVTEVTYPSNYYRELNPNTHVLALGISGIDTRDLGAPFVYLELGCGLGLSTLVHAAANPQATFYAVDVNPNHIAIARGIAVAAKLDNVFFLDLAFEDMALAGLPQFDVVAMHGVWSWINTFNRTVILGFIDKHLKSGGVVYSSYNTLPGYSAIMPLRELMMIGYRRADGPVERKVEAGLAFGQHIKELQATYFRANPLVAKYLDDIMPLGRNYLAHDCFNADWRSFHFSEVAAQKAPLGLHFAGSARVIDQLEGLNFTAEARAEINKIEDTVERETLKDLFLNTQFRRDLFVRHAKRAADRITPLLTLSFVAAVLPTNVHLVVGTSPLGEFRPRADVTLAIVTALAEGPASAVELLRHPAVSQFALSAVMEALLILAALGAAEPAMPAAGLEERKDRTHRLNVLLWERGFLRDEVCTTASPVTGGAVGLSGMEQLFLLARHRGADPIGLVMESANNQDPADISAAYRAFVTARIPLLRNLGIGN